MRKHSLPCRSVFLPRNPGRALAEASRTEDPTAQRAVSLGTHLAAAHPGDSPGLLGGTDEKLTRVPDTGGKEPVLARHTQTRHTQKGTILFPTRLQAVSRSKDVQLSIPRSVAVACVAAFACVVIVRLAVGTRIYSGKRTYIGDTSPLMTCWRDILLEGPNYRASSQP